MCLESSATVWNTKTFLDSAVSGAIRVRWGGLVGTCCTHPLIYYSGLAAGEIICRLQPIIAADYHRLIGGFNRRKFGNYPTFLEACGNLQGRPKWSCCDLLNASYFSLLSFALIPKNHLAQTSTSSFTDFFQTGFLM